MRIFAACCLLATPLLAYEIPNAGFEDPAGESETRPARWSTSHEDAARFRWDAAVSHGGSHSVGVEAEDAASMPPYVAAWRQDVPAPPPGRYVINVWVRGRGLSGPASIRMLLKTDKPSTPKTVLRNQNTPTPRGDFDWRQVSAETEITPEMKYIQFVLGLARTTGKVWFDDVALTPADEFDAGLGQVEFSPAEPLPVASNQPLSVTYTVGALGLRPGGGLRVRSPRWREERLWRRIRNPRAECSRPGVRFQFRVGRVTKGLWPPVAEDGILTAVTTPDSPPLEKGDRAHITWQVQTPDDDSEITHVRLSVDAYGDGSYQPVGEVHTWALQGGPPSRLMVTGTPTPAPNEDARLLVAAFDGNGNPAVTWSGEVRLSVEGGASTVPDRIVVRPEDHGSRRIVVRFLQTGIFHVSARCGRLAGRSHPIWVRDNRRDARIFFGDMHVHGELSGDAVGPIEREHIFARDFLGLDFVSLADHSPRGAKWVRTKQVNEAFRLPPWYETINGYERSFRNGHKNVYYPDDDPPYIHGANSVELWKNLGGRPALTIPHTPNTNSGVKRADGQYAWNTMDWGPRNEQYQRVVEIVQTRSSYEQDEKDPALRIRQGGYGKSVQDALTMGHTLGFIGSTDTHNGKPGSKQGWAAIVAPRLERRALWESLNNRRCYATSGARILLECTLNGRPMGSQVVVDSPTAPREIRAHIVGASPLQRIDLIRDKRVIASASPSGIETEFRARDEEPLSGRSFYYVRVIQQDTHMAWASPIWVQTR